jgi:hypothetical protein
MCAQNTKIVSVRSECAECISVDTKPVARVCYRHNLHACSNAVYGTPYIPCVVNYHAVKINSINLFLLLLFVLDRPLDALDERLNSLATSQRHGATPDGTAVFDLEAKSLSNHRKAAIPQGDC